MRLFIVALLGLPLTALSSPLDAPCGGTPGTWRVNPDGSLGGFVAATASVATTVKTGVDTAVCDVAQVLGTAELSGRARVSGRALIDGQVHVSERAQVKGDAQIFNPGNATPAEISGHAQIYGNATLDGSVIITDTAKVYGSAVVRDYVELRGTTEVCGQAYLFGEAVLENDTTYCSPTK